MMKPYRFKVRQQGGLYQFTPIFILALLSLEIYAMFMVAHICTLHEAFENNASIIMENQALLPEATIPIDFNGDLSKIVYEEDTLHRVCSGNYNVHNSEGKTYVAIDGHIFEAVVTYACVEESFVVTDGSTIHLVKRPTYWDISLGQGILGRFPDVFCKFLMLPLCALILPNFVNKYERGDKFTKVFFYFILVLGGLLGVVLSILSCVLLYG